MSNQNIQIKSKKRVADHGEVFTNEREVKAMCDMVGHDAIGIESRVLEPACGDGNFLAEILSRKLAQVSLKNPSAPEKWTSDSLIALTSIYGIEILADNAQDCRQRLRDLWCAEYLKSIGTVVPPAILNSVETILNANILCGDALTLKCADGSPIVFPRWDALEDGLVKRTDFELATVLEMQRNGGQGDLFLSSEIFDWELGAFIPKPLRIYAPVTLTDIGDLLDISAISNKEVDRTGLRFSLIIGNPPYQQDDGGAQSSAKPLYHLFIQTAKLLKPENIAMIVPSRWFSGGKNLNDFRQEMIHDDSLCIIHDFPHAEDCFPGVEIKGGVNYFLWKRSHHGPCHIYTHSKGNIVSEMVRPLIEPGCDTFIRSNEAIAILRKVRKLGEPSFAEKVNSAMVFGLRTFFRDFDSDTPQDGMVRVYANQCQGYIKRSRIKRSDGFIDQWKVIVPEASGTGDTERDKLKPILSAPGSVNTETYIMNGPWKDRDEAENVVAYMGTRFFHFLLGLVKLTQHTTATTYSLVPMQDFSKCWTDEDLYEKYGLTDDEIRFIEKSVWPVQS